MARRDDFRHARFRRRLCRWSLFLSLSLFLVLANRFAWLHPHRFGASSTLQAPRECIALARSLALAEPLQFYVVYDDGDGFEEAEALRTALQVFLENTRVAMARGGVSFSYAFLHRMRQGGHLRRWFSPQPVSSGLFLRAGDRIIGLAAPSCYILRNGEVRGFSFGTALLAAMRSLANPNPPTIFFSRGHGERSPDQWRSDGGLARLRLWIGQQGWKAESVEIGQLAAREPGNCLLLIADPRSPFTPSEQVALQRFLSERQGRLLLLLTPESRAGLEDLLFQWNVLADAAGPREIPAEWDEGVAVRRFAAVDFLRPLLDYRLPVQFDSVRQVREDLGGAGQVSVTALLEFSGHPPFPVAVLAAPALGDALPIRLPAGELAVVGGDFLSNRHFTLLGNQLFFQQLANHLLGNCRPPEESPPDEFRLHLSRTQLRHVGRVLLFGPAALLALAFLIRWQRRR
ncbi:MAG: GldG family protein [Puniceicoccales bacterium]|jgi:hypothetical protein|nr:GldG family protein [Puniceicoccales bacterium]